MSALRIYRLAAFAGGLLLAACVNGEVGAPFSYSGDRCAGSQNQCQLDCAGIEDNGPARSACIQRCFTNEDACYATGTTTGSSIAVDRAIGAARSEREREEEFQQWKREKQARESAEKEAEEAGSEQ
ncbi:MAG: hypothetical protein RIE56_12230 [Amphiplicatus sp.]